MDTPDMIYLSVIASPLLHRDVIENHWMEVQSPFAKENIAYIRKDALLEWAKSRIEQCDRVLALGHDSMIVAQRVLLVQLINKLCSL